MWDFFLLFGAFPLAYYYFVLNKQGQGPSEDQYDPPVYRPPDPTIEQNDPGLYLSPTDRELLITLDHSPGEPVSILQRPYETLRLSLKQFFTVANDNTWVSRSLYSLVTQGPQQDSVPGNFVEKTETAKKAGSVTRMAYLKSQLTPVELQNLQVHALTEGLGNINRDAKFIK